MKIIIVSRLRNLQACFTIFSGILLACPVTSIAQNPGPWNSPLMITTSADGVTFSTPQMFQDSSGVPSLARDPAGKLIAAFQWFPAPMHGPHWDSVAVKFSSDGGLTWSYPEPIVVNGLPPGFQRPFDPAIAITDNGMYRIYFSSGIPPFAGADSTIDTYSAISPDGVHYQFEPGARVNHPSKRVIDPTVLKFNGLWHYTAPAGAPQEGAYHYISNDGLLFQPTPVIPSDPTHNWTGNLMIENNNEMRFYGCGPEIWYSATPDGGQWAAPAGTNMQGGDPAVIKTGPGSYLMIFVAPPTVAGIGQGSNAARTVLTADWSADAIRVNAPGARAMDLFSPRGERCLSVIPVGGTALMSLSGFAPGVYLLHVRFPDFQEVRKVIKQ